MTLNLILASSYPNGAIGESGGLPWSVPGDLAYFRRITTRHPSAIIMGRRTWESFGSKSLPRRKNIVVSKTLADSTEHKNDDELEFMPSLETALTVVGRDREIFIIGGAALYAEAIGSLRDVKIYHTEIYAKYPKADVHWKIPDEFRISHVGPLENEIDGKSGVKTWFRRCEWVRRGPSMPDIGVPLITHCANQEEKQYLDLLKRVCETGVSTGDRTNTGVRSVMGAHFRYNLRTGFPAITTKPLFWKGVVEELLWILSGSTNAKHLASCGVHIWDLDTSREKLDERGRRHLIVGDAGATYGFNMRHYGAEYKGCLESYDGLGEDQLANCIKTLTENPTDRRMIINLWDPTTLNNCALPPCLLMYVFYVAGGELSCFTVQRSADLMLGVPFNIASSALFTEILANMAGLVPGDLEHNMVNAHIYNNHLAAVQEQLQREPFAKCKLQMPTDASGAVKKLSLEDIDARPRVLGYRDFQLVGYRNHPALKNPTPMAA